MSTNNNNTLNEFQDATQNNNNNFFTNDSPQINIHNCSLGSFTNNSPQLVTPELHQNFSSLFSSDSPSFPDMFFNSPTHHELDFTNFSPKPSQLFSAFQTSSYVSPNSSTKAAPVFKPNIWESHITSPTLPSLTSPTNNDAKIPISYLQPPISTSSRRVLPTQPIPATAAYSSFSASPLFSSSPSSSLTSPFPNFLLSDCNVLPSFLQTNSNTISADSKLTISSGDVKQTRGESKDNQNNFFFDSPLFGLNLTSPTPSDPPALASAAVGEEGKEKKTDPISPSESVPRSLVSSVCSTSTTSDNSTSSGSGSNASISPLPSQHSSLSSHPSQHSHSSTSHSSSCPSTTHSHSPCTLR